MRIPSLLARDNPRQNLVVALCLGGLLLLGLLIWRDYGISFDSGQSRNIGMINLRYVLEKVNPGFLKDSLQNKAFSYHTTPLYEFQDRDYGVAYELPVTLGERLLRLSDTRAIYLFRHLCTFLVSYAGVLALFGLGRRRYGGDWRAGLAAAGLLVLSPRLFGEFFYNDKDAVFMALTTIATYTTVRFVEQPTGRWAILHALACAIAIDVRIMAILWPAATVVLVAARWVRGEYATRPTGQRSLAVLLYAALLPALVVAFWPYLWAAPWANFQQAFSNMSHFRWVGGIWYHARIVWSDQLPWHYAPQWILVTTPLLQVGLFLIGLVVIGRQLVRYRWWGYRLGTQQWQDVLFLGLGLAPIVAVLVLHSVLYDGWRQLYFVYPSLLLLALRGLLALWRWLATRPLHQQRLVVGVLVLGVLSTAGQMVWMHPLESLYFNRLAGPHGNENYECDYWGISFGEGLKWVLAHDDRPLIRVCTNGRMSAPLGGNREILLEADKKRILVVENPDEADYFLGNYRWHNYPFDMPNHVHDVRASQAVALSIYRLRW